MSTPSRIVIVGASLGGLRAAEQLRAAGWDRAIEVIGAEPHLPYNRPPLSKELLTGEPLTAEQAAEKTALRRRRSAADVDFRLGTAAVSADLIGKTLSLSDGSRTNYDGLVIATGLRARQLNVPGPEGGRHRIRTVEDSLALQQSLQPGARVVVIGAGFIGCEIAASASARGCKVTLVEGGKGPMHRPLGPEVAAAFRAWIAGKGIGCLAGRQIAEFLPAEHDAGLVGAVRLVPAPDVPSSARAETVTADVVVEAVGSVPNTEWLEGNGLDLSDGVLADAQLRVVGAAEAVAVGDIVRFPDVRLGGTPRRVEHWATPGDTAKTAARTLVAELTGTPLPPPCHALPNFWSDQFGLRVTGLGNPALADNAQVLEGSLEAIDDGVVVGYFRTDLATGENQLIGTVLAAVPPKTILYWRQQLSAVLAAA